MQPIDYTIDVQTPFQSAVQGYQFGSAIRDDQAKRQQQEAVLQQQQLMQEDLYRFSQIKNPRAADYAAITTRYPQLSESFKRSWDMLRPEQQKNDLAFGTQVYAATQSGRHDIAERLLRDRSAALRNAGDEDQAKQTEVIAELMKLDPNGAERTVGLMLSSVDPDKFAETFSKLGGEQRAQDQAPADLAKKQADAAKAGIDAKYAEQGAVLDLQKKGWDIKAIQEDIDIRRDANRIALMNAQSNREGNTLRREELKLKVQEARTALDDKIRGKVADAEASATSIDNSLNTIERIKGNKSLDDVLGAIEGRMPAVLSDEAANAIALIETLGSQAFLSQVANLKGMGALSNAEGEKLQAALTNLSRVQGEPQFRSNLDDAARLLKKGRETLSKRTGVPLGAPDTPAAPGSRPPLESFNRGGASGEY